MASKRILYIYNFCRCLSNSAFTTTKLTKRNTPPLATRNFPQLNMSTNNIKIDNVTYECVKTLKDDKNVLLIDVREPKELANTGVLPGSINIPLGKVENVLKNMSAEEFESCYGRPKPNFDFPLVFSCQSGKRSRVASETAIKLGYCNVRNYGGGWQEWEKKMKTSCP